MINMANPIIYKKLYKNFSETSRYASSEVILYGIDQKPAYTTYKAKKFAFNLSDPYYEITKEMEFRPDKLSYKIYGVRDYWWKIMQMNNMKDILEFRAGRTIRLPSNSLMFL